MGVVSLSWNFCLLFGCPVWGKHHLEPLRLHLLTGSTPNMLQLNLDVEELSPTKIIHIYFFLIYLGLVLIKLHQNLSLRKTLGRLA